MTSPAVALAELTPRQALDVISHATGLNDDALAQALSTNRRTIQRWKTGQSYPQQAARRQLAMLLKVAEHLRATFRTDDSSHSWMTHPNRYLGGLTPAEVIRVGRSDRADAALEVVDLGMFV